MRSDVSDLQENQKDMTANMFLMVDGLKTVGKGLQARLHRRKLWKKRYKPVGVMADEPEEDATDKAKQMMSKLKSLAKFKPVMPHNTESLSLSKSSYNPYRKKVKFQDSD